MRIEPNTRIRRNPRVVFRRMRGGEAVLLHLDTAAYHGLNATGASIWEHVRGGITLEELIRETEAAVDDPPESLPSEVTGFVTDLIERGLLEVGVEPGWTAERSDLP